LRELGQATIGSLLLHTPLEPAMNETLDLFVGRRLRWRRKLLGLSQSNLADLIGVRFQQIQKYEAAINRLSAARLWTLACVLGVDVQYFYDGWVGPQGAGEPPDAPQTTGLPPEQQGREPQSGAPQSQAA
jgi:transcriptional regulator with XRE-family HTH domain